MKSLLIVVDDDPDDIEFFSIALRELNANCDFKSFLNGIEFLQFFKDERNIHQPTSVILDINMPMISGVELLRMMQDHKLIERIPLYIVTTAGSFQYESKCKALGAKGFFTKPVCGNEWRDIVQLVLQSAR